MTDACVIVIGHVDHGKTALVRALTGTDTDRMAEEKARGLSITLGFAHCDLPSGTLDLIDAPGHEDFIRAMISGATGAQAALLVVSAVDGVSPQTVEHLRIAQLLDLPICAVAISKTDLLAEDALSLRMQDIHETLMGLGVEDARLVPCSAVASDGMSGLRQALDRLVPHLPPANAPDFAYLPVDRVFSVDGRGTVVTGTLLGGSLQTGETITLQPRSVDAVVRGLQTRGAAHDTVLAGGRTAVNLRGVSAGDVLRGDVICAKGHAGPSDCVDVHLTVLETAAKPLKHMQDIRVLFGTSHDVAVLRLMGGGQVKPGQSRFAQLRFRHPVVGFAGQRMILRSLSPAATLGRALLLDPQAGARKAGDRRHLSVMEAALSQDTALIAQALCAAGKGVAETDDLRRMSRGRGAIPVGFVQIGGARMAATRDIATTQEDIRRRLRQFHATNPLKIAAPLKLLEDRGLSPHLLGFVVDQMVLAGAITQREDCVALVGHDPLATLTADQQTRMASMEKQVAQAGMSPPDPADICATSEDTDLFNLLIAQGRLVTLTNIGLKRRIVFHARALADAEAQLRRAFLSSFTTGQAREALGTTRRFIIPILEHFDALGVTTRAGDRRSLAPPA
jgi:selenocysteine-specific elongation factor